jgi:hypothetical protein
MNWDQIESKWSAMTRRVRLEWGGEAGKEQQATVPGTGVVAVEMVMVQETGLERGVPKRTVRI